jgi:hypothetical protein
VTYWQIFKEQWQWKSFWSYCAGWIPAVVILKKGDTQDWVIFAMLAQLPFCFPFIVWMQPRTRKEESSDETPSSPSPSA